MDPKTDILKSVQHVQQCTFKGRMEGTSQLTGRFSFFFLLRVHRCVQVYVSSIMVVYCLVYDHNGISRGIEKL
jgi:hypothetical protein